MSKNHPLSFLLWKMNGNASPTNLTISHEYHARDFIIFNQYSNSSYIVNSNGGVCDQKISKLFVSHVEESMAGYMGVN
jgi:hypothetical protein